jgi:hypothetical protein
MLTPQYDFPCFTSTKVQRLTPERYEYKSANTDAKFMEKRRKSIASPTDVHVPQSRPKRASYVYHLRRQYLYFLHVDRLRRQYLYFYVPQSRPKRASYVRRLRRQYLYFFFFTSKAVTIAAKRASYVYRLRRQYSYFFFYLVKLSQSRPEREGISIRIFFYY